MNGEQDRVRVLPHEQTTETDKRIRVKSQAEYRITRGDRQKAGRNSDIQETSYI